MTALAWLVPVALGLGAAGLAAFMWSLKSGQFEDLEGAGWRALDDDRDSLKATAPVSVTEQPSVRPSSP